MGRSLEIAQWALISLIIIYLIVGTYFAFIFLKLVQSSSVTDYELEKWRRGERMRCEG